MTTFSPRQRNELYAELSAAVLAFTPITSAELGEVLDNISFGLADQIYETYVEMVNALALLKLINTTGSDLDDVASEYPNLVPRFEATNASGPVEVTDPTVTKIETAISAGGASAGNGFLNVGDTGSLPSSGKVLVGVRGSSSFEEFNYDSKNAFQLQSTTDTIDFDHGSGEPVVLATVGDRIFPGPFTVATEATADLPQKQYTSISQLTIFDGEDTGEMTVQSDESGVAGNIPSTAIKNFIGVPPFPGAVVTNTVKFSNATSREKDADLRERIRRERQSLSTANVDAITSALFGVNNEGQTVRFVQLVEDPDPCLPSTIYIDDGSGFTPSQDSISDPIVLIDSALGEENRFRIDMDLLPLVTNDAENVTRIFTNITLELNSVVINQGDGAGEYRVQPDSGIIKLNTPLTFGDHLEITSLTHYTGLVSLANKTIYGDREDRENYRGVAGLGQWPQLRAPSVQFVNISGDVTLDGSQTIDIVVENIKSRMLEYVNNLGIGVTVVRNRLEALAFVSGVKDFTLTNPVANVSVPDGSLAKTTTGNITIS